jgi:TolB-like protein
MAEQHSFFEELKRRHVWRVAIAYAVASWLIVQIATQIFPVFHMPEWTEQIVVILVVIGFPVMVVFAWAFEWTPGGIRRTEPADSPDARPQAASHQTGHKLNIVIVAVLILAVALLGWRLLALRRTATSPVRSPDVAQRNPEHPIPDSAVGAAASGLHATAFNPPADSIVVLPFANMSDDPKQAYFSNGITQELTSALGQNTELTVIAWNTASRYAESGQSPSDIGRALNVAHVLAGSVQRAGPRVRVSVELVSTVNGRQLWAAHYDDSMKNIFAVQDKISAEVADALKVKFAGMHAAPTLDPQAHDLYLKGLVALDRATATDAQAAQGFFQQALALDPNYADAWAGLAQTYVWLSLFSTLPLEEALPKMRAAAHRALALDPHNINALLSLGDVYLSEQRIADARTKYAQALEYDPSNSAAHQRYGLVLPLKAALVQFQEAARLDPDNSVAQSNLSLYHLDLADWPRAVDAANALNKAAPKNTDAAFLLAFAYTQMQRGEDAVKAFDLVQPATPLDKQLIDAGRLTYRALLQPSLRAEALAALDPLRRADISPIEQVDLIQLFLALGEKRPALELLPGFCTASSPVGCNDLAINPIYSPLRGDPIFEKLSKQYTTVTLGAAPASASSR